MRMLITGSQRWVQEGVIKAAMLNQSSVRIALYDVKANPPPRKITVVHGACGVGADLIADRVARDQGWTIEPHPADWSRHGRPAGQIRNDRMVRMGADVCLAFIRDRSPGASTTASKARREGIHTLVWRHDGDKIYLDTEPVDRAVNPDQGRLF